MQLWYTITSQNMAMDHKFSEWEIHWRCCFFLHFLHGRFNGVLFIGSVLLEVASILSSCPISSFRFLLYPGSSWFIPYFCCICPQVATKKHSAITKNGWLYKPPCPLKWVLVVPISRNKPHINLVQKAPFQDAIATYLASLAMC